MLAAAAFDISDSKEPALEAIEQPVSTFSSIELQQMAESADDPWRLTLGPKDKNNNNIQPSPSTDMIKCANRTAQILLQDKGINLTRSLRQKIVNYQSDLGYQLLSKRVQGLLKLGITTHNIQKRIAF